MRVPQVNERVKEAPAHALRAIFAGIGQLLSVSDKVRNKPAATKTATPETATQDRAAPEMRSPGTAAPETAAPETVVAPETATPETATPEMATPETATPEMEPEATATPETMNVRAAAGGHVKLLPPDETTQAPAASPSTVAPKATVAPEATPAAAASAELPLPNYDALTIASLRARLRNLSADQLTQLITYEKGHANRADVISMFERRVAKLAEG